MKDRDREMMLRKDLYLEAAEALHAGVQCLGNATNLNMPEEALFEDALEPVRNELEMPVDIAKFRALNEQAIARATLALRTLVNATIAPEKTEQGEPAASVAG
jgi:hypothetical protein